MWQRRTVTIQEGAVAMLHAVAASLNASRDIMLQRIRLRISFFVGMTLFLITTAHADTLKPLLQNYEAEYSISWMGVPVASSVHQLIAMPNGQFLFEAKAAPFLTLLPYDYYESSLFKSSGNEIIPLEYIYDHQEGRKKKQGKLFFNWSHLSVKDLLPNQPWQAPLPQGTQDKYTNTLLLRRDLMAGKQHFSYSVVEGHEIKNYHYEIIGTESLETDLGRLETTKVQLVSGNRTTVLWMAKDFNYLLVKLIQYKNGSKILNGEIRRYSE